MTWFILTVELLLAIELRLRLKSFNAAEVLCWYIGLSQIVYLNSETFFELGLNWETDSFITHPMRAIWLYAGMFMLFYCSTIGIRRPKVTPGSYRAQMQRIVRTTQRFEGYFLVIVAVAILIQMATLRWNIAWHNDEYLLLKSQDANVIGGLAGSLIQNVAIATGFISALFAALSLGSRNLAARFLWIACLTWIIAFNLADSSRAAFTMLTLFLTLALSLGTLRNKPVIILLIALDVLMFVAALTGRAGVNFGLSGIPSILASPFTQTDVNLPYLIGNLFQGIAVTADGLDYKTDFATIYKILSFSPAPGGLDGFSKVLEMYQIRLSLYVPMSAITEVIKFGPIYTALLFGTFFLVCRRMLSGRARLGILYYFASAYVILLFVQGNAYPVRNIYRGLIYLYILVEIILVVRRRSRPSSGRPRRPKSAVKVPTGIRTPKPQA